MRKPCCDKEDTNVKGAWSNQEDQKLIDYIRKHGEGCWRTLPQAAGLSRCGKSCRLRWINYLRPDIKRGKFSEDEEDLIIKLHALLGNRWSLIAGRLPGRTDNEVKNYWNSHLRRKLMKMGIDPNNHRLNHIPLHIRNHKLSTSTASSSIKIKAVEEVISAPSNPPERDNKQVVISDGRRCLDDKSCEMPDLNLNLSFATVASKIEEGENHNCKSDESRESKVVHSPNTLLLFA